MQVLNLNSDIIVEMTVRYYKKDINGENLINGEKYKHIDTFHQLYPIYDNGLFAPVYITVPTINIPTPMETTDDDEVMKDDITAIKINCAKSDLDVKRKRGRPRKLSIVTRR